MTRDELEQMPQYWGLYFDTATGKTYRDDGTDTGFTFERARWTGPFGLHLSWPWLNPIAFATHETGVKVLEIVQRHAPAYLSAWLDESNRITGPFTRTPERTIILRSKIGEERFSAGLLANSIIRNGEAAAMKSLLAEFRQAERGH